MTPSVDVVVLAHNHWDLTERCLSHLRAQTLSPNVIVCDNGSSDGTPARVREAFPEVRLVELGANLGFSVGNNRGVEAGHGEIVVLLNNDVLCRPDFLERLVAPFGRDERLGSLAPLLLHTDDERIESFGLAVDPTLAGFPRLQGVPVQQLDAKRPVLLGPSGAAAGFRRRAWEAVGGLDEAVFFYGEDVDLALRLRSAGWRAAEAVDAVATHIGSASAGHRSSWQRYQGGYSRGYFLRRYGVLRRRVALRALAAEVIAVFGDAFVFSRDLAALRGRIDGWRAAGVTGRNPWPPEEAIDSRITFRDSLRRRFRVYTCT
jgi:N-acetylglucosaminyl-diphospho-decaprenol L-rhamnosyltransferase